MGIGIALDTRDPSNPEVPSYLFMIIIAITLTVAAIPEGIPLCITIAQAAGCSQMVEKNVLVRRIAAVETLGSASVICSDKTGTLTEGKMRAVKMWSAGTEYAISGTGFDPTTGEIQRADDGKDGSACAEVRSTLLAALLNSNARVDREEEDGEVRWVPHGNSSEVPIVVAAGKIGLQAEDAERVFPRVFQVPFSSSRKMMLTVCRTTGQTTLGDAGITLPTGTEMLACVKGAPNYIIDACTSSASADGSVAPLTENVRSEIMGTIDRLSSQALRVLAIAVQPLAELPFSIDEAEELSADEKMAQLCKNMTFLGLVASLDPPREGVQGAVQAAHEGNIQVVMITGDYLKTAAAIARDIGILDSRRDGCAAGEALDCSVLRPNGDYIPETEIDTLTKQARVFARAQPEDKLQIVHSLQRQGLVCAMTGDGVNDAPALKASDIGVAMGIQGTEVAKGASDVILTDDNFCSIVGAVEKGRVIYAGIQKFVAFIMSVHIAEILQILVCIVGAMPVMRTPLQILFLILVTDLAPSIALGLEPGQRGIMKERPRPKEQPIVLRWMWQSIVMNGMILSAVIFVVYLFALNMYVGEFFQDDMIANEMETPYKKDLERARTVAFISLVLSENVRAYTSRSFDKPVWTDLWKNKQMQMAIVMAQVALLLAVFVPGVTTVLGLAGSEIGAEGWGIAFAGPVLTLILCEMYKVVVASQIRRFNDQVKDAGGRRSSEGLRS